MPSTSWKSDGIRELTFDVNNDCIKSSRVNLTLKMNHPISCQLMEDFVHASKWRGSEPMGFRHCEATNHLAVSGSCDLDCQCQVRVDDPCKVTLLMNPYVRFKTLHLSEIDFHY